MTLALRWLSNIAFINNVLEIPGPKTRRNTAYYDLTPYAEIFFLPTYHVEL